MEQAKAELLKDIQAQGSYMLAALEMKYAVASVAGEFGEAGLAGVLEELEAQGSIKYDEKRTGPDTFTIVKPTKTK